MEKEKWIRAFEYAKLKNTSMQNVYRWIREGKISSENVKKEIVQVERIMIKISDDNTTP